MIEIILFAVFATVSQAENTKTKNACDDLYAYACLDSNGKPKVSTDQSKIRADMYKIIEEGREKVARAMGFTDFNEGLIAQLKVNGLAVKPDTPEIIFDILKNKPDSRQGINQFARKISPDAEACYQAANKESTQDYDQFSDIWEKKSVSFRAKNLPLFISDYIAGECKTLRDHSEKIDLEKNQKTANTCENFDLLKKNAELIFRKKGTPEYVKLAEQFVQENLLPNMVYKDPKKNQQNRANLEDVCDGFAGAVWGNIEFVTDSFLLRISQNKIIIDHLIQSHYSDSQKSKFDRLFQENKKYMLTVLDPLIQEPQKKQKIFSQFNKISYTWLTPPQPSKYKKSAKDDQYYLNWDELSPNELEKYGPFDSADLSHFYEVNASYNARSTYGEVVSEERLSFMPSFLSQLDSNPALISEVLGHELGHKVDPNVGVINGHSLNQELAPLLSCLAQPGSIKMRGQQKGEATSDVLAAEIAALKMKELKSVEERLKLLSDSVSGYCGFESDQIKSFHSNCKATHPPPRYRIGGLFGANSSIRKVLGCSEASKDFATCGLDSPLMPTPSRDWDGDSEDVVPIQPKIKSTGSDSAPVER